MKKADKPSAQANRPIKFATVRMRGTAHLSISATGVASVKGQDVLRSDSGKAQLAALKKFRDSKKAG